jgi:hypothetical protein
MNIFVEGNPMFVKMNVRYPVFCFLLCLTAQAQKISRLSHEVSGSKIIIAYDISEARPEQSFEVSLYCSADNFQKPLQSVSGNGVGLVEGGGQKNVVWDVFSDRNELKGNISFEIRALVVAEQKKNTIIPAVENVTSRTGAYNLISSTLEDYLNQVKDVKDAFRTNTDRDFNDRQAFEALSQTTLKYNAIFEKINKERPVYENFLEEYWKNPVTTTQFASLMEYTLGEVHRVSVLTLNQYVNELNTPKIRKSKTDRTILIRDINQQTAQLAKKIELLEDRKTKMLNVLVKK